VSEIARPALRYPGGKWRLAPWIISFFPSHDCYVEPYGGAASVLLQKPPAPYEVYNDLESDVVNFFQVLRERTDEFTHAVWLTPWSREEFRRAAQRAEDPFEQARRFFVRCWQSHSGGGISQWSTGWSYQKPPGSNKPAVESWSSMTHLWAIADRFKRTQIEHDPARAVIARFDAPRTLFYCDPPYVDASRSKWQGKMYREEMSDEEHGELAGLLHEVQGMVVLSGYPSALYDRLYAGWPSYRTEARANFAHLRTEVVWLSPRTEAALAAERAEDWGPLFESLGEDR
jgi:DNA adenine methylase